jgi:hypothetical protein
MMDGGRVCEKCISGLISVFLSLEESSSVVIIAE